jgi:4-amino-4-deoxy-L-arabinose transferase-like glycosyltransferase
MKKRKTQIALIVLVVLFLLSLRMIHPSADPPETLSTSGGPYGDPGGYAFHARNKILFGQWKIDEMNSPLYASPIPALLTYLSFKLFGIGFVPMNVIPILFSCLSLIFVFFILKDTLDSSLSIVVIGFSFPGLNYLFLMYSRVANRVMPMIFFLIMALFFFLKGSRKRNWYFFAGVSTFLAFMTKSVCFYIVGAFFLGFFVYLIVKWGLKKALAPFGFYFTGFLICLLFWVIFIYIPHGDEIKDISSLNVPYLIPPKNVSKMLYYFWIRPSILLERAPVISLLSGFFLLLLFFRVSQTPKKIRLIEWIMLFWIAISVVYFSIIQQRVPRHFIPQIIPMVFLSAWLIRDFLRAENLVKPTKPRFVFGMGLFFWLLFPLSRILKAILEEFPAGLSNLWIATSLLAVITFFVTLIIVFLIKQWPEDFQISLSPLIRKSAVALILLGVIFFNGRPYLAWALHPQFKLQNVSRDLGKAFDHAAISGLWAPVICLENRHRAHESYPGLVNDQKDFFEKFEITHVFASTAFNNQEINYYRRNFPEAMQRARLLAKYHIWRASQLLYELHPSPEAAMEEGLYEAETFTESQGMPRYDPQSSGKFSVRAEKRKSGFVSIISPGREIFRGRYRVTFRMKLEENPLKNVSRIARLDVVSPDTRRLLMAKDLFADDFLADNTYQEFSLSVDLNRPLNLRFRVYSDGTVSFWIDCIRIERISEV